jgi:hypothetical protein
MTAKSISTTAAMEMVVGRIHISKFTNQYACSSSGKT